VRGSGSEEDINTPRLSGPLIPTGENGLVHTQGGGFDGDEPDVGWHFVTN